MKTRSPERQGRAATTLRRGWRIAQVALLSLTLAACASVVRNDVMVYHDWPEGLDKPWTYRLKPAAEGQADDLAWRTWARLIEAELAKAGFVPADQPALEVGFSYAEVPQRTRVVERAPLIRSSVTLGHRFSHGGISIGFPLWYEPWYDRSYEVSSQVRELKLEIADLRGPAPTRIYQASAVNRSARSAQTEALPYLMRAVLADFPGRSGVAREVDLPLPAQATGQ